MGVSLVQSTATWLQFPLVDRTTGDPLLGIPSNEVEVWYAKAGSLVMVQKVLVDVVDPNDPQPGENYVHVGDGVYAVLFTNLNLDTLGSFTWIAKQSGIAVQDFQQHSEVDTVGLGEGFIATIDSIQSGLTALSTAVDDGFTAVGVTLADIQVSLVTLTSKIDAVQATINSVEGEIPSGITGSTVAP